MSAHSFEDLRVRVDLIEEGYEFFLAYAAQGLAGDDSGSAAGQRARDYLRRCEDALEGLVDAFREHLPNAAAHEDALRVLERDVESSLALVRLVAAQDAVSSQLIDNLNASIHLRALLTDLFVLGEVMGL